VVGSNEVITLTNHDGLLTLGTVTLGLSKQDYTQVAVCVDGQTMDSSQYTADFDSAQVVIRLKQSVSIAAGGRRR